MHVQILKTVGLLGILGEFSHLRASPEAICLALNDDPSSVQGMAALGELRARSLLTFRRFDGTFRIWEGSDIDVDERLEEARRRTGQHLDLAATLQRYLPPRPIVARRHSYESGAVRYFEVRYLAAAQPPEQLRPENGADGVVALCLPVSQLQAHSFAAWATGPSYDWPLSLLVVVPMQAHGLREAAAELRALNWVWENTPGLRDDRIARRELSERTTEAELSLNRALDLLLDPRPEPEGNLAAWHHRGRRIQVASLTAAKQYLSTVMQDVYASSPRIRNELVNRRSLSSAAAAARRTLIDRMLSQSSQPLLGMTGYPPERSMYESVLLDTGLHRNEDGVWMFGPPPAADPRYVTPVWEELQAALFAPSPEPVAVDSLFAQLSAPPFGVLAGVLPILLVAFILAYPDEMSLYREGRFVPEPSIADYEVLMRRPELFSVAAIRIAGERAAVVQRLGRGLNVQPAIVPVTRALIRAVRSLPETSWRTHRLSAPVLAVRRAFDQSRSPERLLFYDLPIAVGEDPFLDDGAVDVSKIGRFFDKFNAALNEWSRHAPGQTVWARDTLLQACGLPPSESGWNDLIQKAGTLACRPMHSSLISFVSRLSAPREGRAVLESVLAVVAGKPPKSWHDTDVDQYPTRAGEIGERFRYAYEALAPLSVEELSASQHLTARLRSAILHSVSRRVARSALAALLTELSAESGGQP